jgi:hypothetical protein
MRMPELMRKRLNRLFRIPHRLLAWAYVEAATFAVRSTRAKAFHQRKRAKTNNAIATKALANKLARASFYMMRDQSVFDEKRLYG